MYQTEKEADVSCPDRTLELGKMFFHLYALKLGSNVQDAVILCLELTHKCILKEPMSENHTLIFQH